MSKETSVRIGDHFADFVEEQVNQGRYASSREVVHAGLRLLEEREAHLANLRAALIEGETSGFATPFDFDEFIARKHAERAKR